MIIKACVLALALAAGAAWAQERPPGGLCFEEVVVSVVEAPTPPPTQNALIIITANAGQPQVVERCFTIPENCAHARELINSTGFSIPLGTGGGATAHVGRSLTPCYDK